MPLSIWGYILKACSNLTERMEMFCDFLGLHQPDSSSSWPHSWITFPRLPCNKSGHVTGFWPMKYQWIWCASCLGLGYESIPHPSSSSSTLLAECRWALQHWKDVLMMERSPVPWITICRTVFQFRTNILDLMWIISKLLSCLSHIHLFIIPVGITLTDIAQQRFSWWGSISHIKS